jgi:hypothetical protein
MPTQVRFADHILAHMFLFYCSNFVYSALVCLRMVNCTG